jgi:hypothetical protein
MAQAGLAGRSLTPRRKRILVPIFILALAVTTYDAGNSLSLMKREVGVSRIPRGLRQVALSISFLSPIFRRPEALLAIKIASLIFLPERRFVDFTSFQSRMGPSLSFGSSSLISLRRHSFSVSRGRFRPPGNIHSRSRLRLTKRTLPHFATISFEDFAISPVNRLCLETRFVNHYNGFFLKMKSDSGYEVFARGLPNSVVNKLLIRRRLAIA